MSKVPSYYLVRYIYENDFEERSCAGIVGLCESRGHASSMASRWLTRNKFDTPEESQRFSFSAERITLGSIRSRKRYYDVFQHPD